MRRDDLTEEGDEFGSVVVVAEDRLLPVAARSDVVDAVVKLEPRSPRHDPTLPPPCLRPRSREAFVTGPAAVPLGTVPGGALYSFLKVKEVLLRYLSHGAK